MRFLRFLPVVAALAVGACADDPGKVTNTVTPPLAYIRYVHAVADAGPLDFRFVDGTVDYSPQYANATFRSIGVYQGARAGARHMRVNLNSTSIDSTQVMLADTTVTLVAGQYYTILHVGYRDSTGTNADRLVFLDDTRPAQDAGLHVSVVNAGQGLANQDFFATAAAATTLVGATPIASNVAPGTRTAYVARATGAMAIQAANTTTTVSNAGTLAAVGTAGTVAADPVGGTSVAGTQFTAFFFPRSRAGSQAANFTTPGVVIVVDRQPPRTVPDA